MIQPLLQAWMDPKFSETLASRQSSYQMLGLEGAIKYLLDTNAMQVPEWENTELNDDGQEVQRSLNTNSKVSPYGSHEQTSKTNHCYLDNTLTSTEAASWLLL